MQETLTRFILFFFVVSGRYYVKIWAYRIPGNVRKEDFVLFRFHFWGKNVEEEHKMTHQGVKIENKDRKEIN